MFNTSLKILFSHLAFVQAAQTGQVKGGAIQAPQAWHSIHPHPGEVPLILIQIKLIYNLK